MSIDEHKEHLLDIMDSMPDDACGDWRDSLAYAITIIRKYQKIEEIIDNWTKPEEIEWAIREVLDNEKIN